MPQSVSNLEIMKAVQMPLYENSLDLGQIEDMFIVLPEFNRFSANDFLPVSQIIKNDMVE
jgi:hypothetical protein